MLPEPLVAAWLPLPEAVLLLSSSDEAPLLEEVLVDESPVERTLLLALQFEVELSEAEAVDAAAVHKAAWVGMAGTDCCRAN